MYRKKQPLENYSKFAMMIICLVKAEIDFNVVVDEDENTALMAILAAHDYETFNFLCRYGKNLDFKKKNKYGENATSLFLKLDYIPLQRNPMIYQRSFDFKYLDQTTKNNALIFIVINKPSYIMDVLKYHYCSINEVNIHQENALIIAAKMNNYNSVELLLQKCANTNQQDDMGNTALHYAVQANNIPMIYDLIHNDANPHLKNNQKESALEMANRLGNKKVLNAILGNLSVSDYSKEKSLMTRSQNVKTPQIDEYLYTNTSNFYSEFQNNNAYTQEIKNVYKNYVDKVNKQRNFIIKQFKSDIDDLLQDLIFCSIGD